MDLDVDADAGGIDIGGRWLWRRNLKVVRNERMGRKRKREREEEKKRGISKRTMREEGGPLKQRRREGFGYWW